MSSSSIEQAMLTPARMRARSARHGCAHSAAKNQALLASGRCWPPTRPSCWPPTPARRRGARQRPGASPARPPDVAEKTLAHMAEGLRQIAALPDPSAASARPACAPTACEWRRCACRWASSASFTSPAPTSPSTRPHALSPAMPPSCARGQRGPAFQCGVGPHRPAGPGRRRPAAGRGAGGRHGRPRRSRQAHHHDRTHRRHRAARRQAA